VTIEQAQQRMIAIGDNVAKTHSESAGRTIRVIPLLADSIGNVRSLLVVLQAAVILVLLIAGANCVNLILARAISRSREISIRLALGAGPSRLVRQFITEGVLLALLGCALALPAAYGMINLLLRLIPDRTSFGRFLPQLDGVRIDGQVFACALLISTLTGIALGLIPALHISLVRVNEQLKEGGRGDLGIAGTWSRDCVVIAEVAVAFVLVIGAGLLLRSFNNLAHIDPGFRSDRVTMASFFLPPSRYAKQEHQRDFLSRLLARIGEAPGIDATAAVNTLPLVESPNPTIRFRLENQPEPRPDEAPEAIIRVATPGYFETMRIPLIGGRYFNRYDVAGKSPIVVINDALARRYWGTENPVGTRVRLAFLKEPFEVAGVVSNTPMEHLQEEPQGALYFCFDQFTNPIMTIAVRSTRDPSDVAAIVRRAARELDQELPLRRVSPMEAIISDSVWLTRFLAVLLGGLAMVALALAAVGVYGLVHYSTSRRTHEIGIRMALGARRRDVLNMLLGRGIKLAVIGIALGIAAAAMVTRTLGTALYRVSPTDPATFVLVAALLVGVAVIASFDPARRASKAEPLIALRME
jgi:putative ABC transport system permease protein